MENAADALKMAGAVLIFVLAISITILSFGQVRQAADTILNYKDRETTYEYYETTPGQYERTVSLETVIPAVFRSYLENYKIVFDFDDGLGAPIYKAKYNGTDIPKYSLDLETNQNTEYQNAVLANDDQKAEFICGILYGDFSKMQGNSPDEKERAFEQKFNVSLTGCESLYSQLNRSGIKITEYLGVYYQNDEPNVPDVNKTEKRIITYRIYK